MKKTKIQKTKEQIIKSSLNIFIEYGYRETTIKMIAKEAGLGYGTIYSHFKLGKEDLLLALMEEVMQKMYEIAERIYTPQSKEEAYNFTYTNTKDYLELALKNKEIFKLIYEAKGVSELINNEWEKITDKFIKRISLNVEVVRSLGLIRNPDYHAEIVSGALYYLGERYLWKLVLDRTTIPVEDISRDIVMVFNNGLYK